MKQSPKISAFLIRLVTDPGFLLCAATLIAGALYVQFTLADSHLLKKELPLKASLDSLREETLLPFRVVRKTKIDNPDMLKELGTNDYIQWELTNTQPLPSENRHSATVFITYYTGDPGLVPHVPDVCYMGGGFKLNTLPAQTVEIADKNGLASRIPLHILEASKRLSDGSDLYATIVYFFCANGKYLNSRNLVRFELNDPEVEYAYFCKVEFTVIDSFKQPDSGAVVKLVKAIGDKLLPVLRAEHLPEMPAPPQADQPQP